MNSGLGVGGVLLRVGLGMFVVRLLLGTVLSSTLALCVAIFFGVLIGGVWVYQQMKEMQESDKLRERERSYR